VLGVNFFGLVNGIQAFLPHLLDHGEGYVVNTASVAGFVAGMYMGPYTISKHAAVALSEVLYHEIQASKWDVGVSVLCPTVTATRIADFDTKGYPASLQGMASTGPS
jgi:short-subunit dehydrogenase